MIPPTIARQPAATVALPLALAVVAAALFAGSGALAQDAPTYSADVPAKITTPDSTGTRIGTLNFNNGAPDDATVDLVYDNLDFMRGVQTFLTGVSATSIRAACNGIETVGIKTNEGFGITEDLMDARSLFLTPNTTTVYGFTCLDLSAGPMVLEVPTGVLGPVDDANFRWVTDIGLTGPDAGKGGKLSIPEQNGSVNRWNNPQRLGSVRRLGACAPK
jgi:hypothetical protein